MVRTITTGCVSVLRGASSPRRLVNFSFDRHQVSEGSCQHVDFDRQ